MHRVINQRPATVGGRDVVLNVPDLFGEVRAPVVGADVAQGTPSVSPVIIQPRVAKKKSGTLGTASWTASLPVMVRSVPSYWLTMHSSVGPTHCFASPNRASFFAKCPQRTFGSHEDLFLRQCWGRVTFFTQRVHGEKLPFAPRFYHRDLPGFAYHENLPVPGHR